MAADLRPARRTIVTVLAACTTIVCSTAWGQSADVNAKLDQVQAVTMKLEEAIRDAARSMAASMEADELTRSYQVASARSTLKSVLKTEPANARACILNARMGVALVLATPLTVKGGKQDPPPVAARDLIAPLDRALAKRPDDAELHYWKGIVYAAPIVPATLATRGPLDWALALGALRRAVELAPDSVRYREQLAHDLLDEGKTDEAREVMRPAQGGMHPMYLLLSDWSRLPRPGDARFTEDLAKTAQGWASHFPGLNWIPARSDGYTTLSSAAELEELFNQRFPGFKLLQVEENEEKGTTAKISMQFLAWKGDTLALDLAFTPTATLEIGTDPPRGIVIVVTEVTNPSAEAREELGIDQAKRACIVALFNSRRLSADSK